MHARRTIQKEFDSHDFFTLFWSLLGSSKTKSWDLSEGLGGAAEPLPWVSAAERDSVLVFYSLVQPTPLNLFLVYTQ